MLLSVCIIKTSLEIDTIAGAEIFDDQIIHDWI